MSTQRTSSPRPRFASADYTSLPSPCVPCREGGQTWYRGSGVAPKGHPLARSIAFEPCGACGSADVLVVAAQFAVHPMSGDIYHDYELVCRACGVFSQNSRADND